MEIREVRYSETVELRRDSFQLNLENAPPQPARLEPPPREGGEREENTTQSNPRQHGLTHVPSNSLLLGVLAADESRSV
mgnify:CR=1 FL=1